MWFYHITQFSVMRETLACLWPGTPPLRYRLLHEIHRNWETCMQLKERVWSDFPSYQRYRGLISLPIKDIYLIQGKEGEGIFCPCAWQQDAAVREVLPSVGTSKSCPEAGALPVSHQLLLGTLSRVCGTRAPPSCLSLHWPQQPP